MADSEFAIADVSKGQTDMSHKGELQILTNMRGHVFIFIFGIIWGCHVCRPIINMSGVCLRSSPRLGSSY